MAKMIKLANYQGLLIILVGALAYLSYTNYNLEQDLEEYKGYYKTIAIKYVQEIMDKPELSAPDPEEMEVTTIDFESNMLLFNDLEGNEFSLRNFENKVLFINYWATWCNPCLAEMPNMAELYNQYKENDNIVFLYLFYSKIFLYMVNHLYLMKFQLILKAYYLKRHQNHFQL